MKKCNCLAALPVSLQDIRDHQAFKGNLKIELLNRVHTPSDCFVCHALLVTYRVSGELKKRELELAAAVAAADRPTVAQSFILHHRAT